MKDSKIEEMVLDLNKKAKKIICEDSCSFWSEIVKKNATSKLGKWLHSNYFLTLCLVNVMKFQLPEKMMNFGDKVQNPYILDFAIPKR